MFGHFTTLCMKGLKVTYYQNNGVFFLSPHFYWVLLFDIFCFSFCFMIIIINTIIINVISIIIITIIIIIIFIIITICFVFNLFCKCMY